MIQETYLTGGGTRRAQNASALVGPSVGPRESKSRGMKSEPSCRRTLQTSVPTLPLSPREAQGLPSLCLPTLILTFLQWRHLHLEGRRRGQRSGGSSCSSQPDATERRQWRRRRQQYSRVAACVLCLCAHLCVCLCIRRRNLSL